MSDDRTYNQYINVLRRPEPKHVCTLPNWRERWRLRIQLNDRIQCRTCRQVWVWKDIGWEDVNKVWEKDGEPPDHFLR